LFAIGIPLAISCLRTKSHLHSNSFAKIEKILEKAKQIDGKKAQYVKKVSVRVTPDNSRKV